MQRVIRELAADRRFQTVVAVTPDKARIGVRAPCFGQGQGDLGLRMERACRRHPIRVAIVGCDIPDLRARDIAAAFRVLGRADAVELLARQPLRRQFVRDRRQRGVDEGRRPIPDLLQRRPRP